jgi:hypothetical protein
MKTLKNSKSNLPVDIYFREQLIEHGYNTIEKLVKCKDLCEIYGIGPISAKHIREYIDNLISIKKCNKHVSKKLINKICKN